MNPTDELALVKFEEEEKQQPLSKEEVLRDSLKKTLAITILQNGFTDCEENALENFTDAMETMLIEFGRKMAKSANKIGRAGATPTDVIKCGLDMGIRIDFTQMLKPENKEFYVLPSPQREREEKREKLLFMTNDMPLPKHIPSFLEPFPPLIAYKKTKCVNKREEYSYVEKRERDAQKKMNASRALNEFMVATNPTVCIYEDESSKIDVVTPQIINPPYMVLLAHDQNFDYGKLEEELHVESTYKRRKLGAHGPEIKDVMSSLTEMTTKCSLKRVPKHTNESIELEECIFTEDNTPASSVSGNYNSDDDKSTNEDDSVTELQNTKKSVIKEDYKPDPKWVEMLFGKCSDDSDVEPNK